MGTQGVKNLNKERHNFDYVLLAVVLVLIGFGLMMIYSASSYDAAIDFGDSAYFLKSQIRNILIGFGFMIVAALFPYQSLRRTAWIWFVAAIVLLLCLKVPAIAITRNGATRWIKFPGIPVQIQPAEFAKIAAIIFTASFINKHSKDLRSFKGFVETMAIPVVLAIMIYLLSKNLSSAIIVLGIAMVMIFVSVPDYLPFIAGAVAIIIVAGIVIFMALNQTDGDSFRMARIAAWLRPEQYSTDRAFQTLQALYAIGSGGIFGKGLGQSMQKRGFLPEAQNDMIFSIICEELGLFGAMVVIVLFVILIWCCMVIANNTVDRFGALLVVGVMAHFAIQVILNIAVVTNVMPNTGITLPFISYGGSATVFLLIEIGMVLNISKSVKV